MNSEQVLAQLHSDSKETRHQAWKDFQSAVQSDPSQLEKSRDQILKLFSTSNDDWLLLQISSLVRDTPLSKDWSEKIIETMDILAERFTMDNEQSYDISMAANLSQAVRDELSTNASLFQKALPTLFKYLAKPTYVRNIAYSFIVPYSNQSPQLLVPYTEKLLDLVRDGYTELITPLMTLYSHRPELFEKEENIKLLVQLGQHPQWGSIALAILVEMSGKKPDLLAPYVDGFVGQLSSPNVAGSAAQILSEIARKHPETLVSHIDALARATKMIPHLKHNIVKIMGLVGRHSEEEAQKILPLLVDFLGKSDQTVTIHTLSQIKNIGDMNKDYLDPYMDKIRQMATDPMSEIRAVSQAIIDRYEGKDLASMQKKFENLNREVKDSISSVDDLRNYVDDHISDLRDFLAEISKKLPIPQRFSSEGRLRKTLKLYFYCDSQGERCLYPEGRPFTTETKEWNKWIKVAVSAVKLGKSMAQTDVGEAFDDVKDLYKSATGEDDQKFLSLVKEPFLTSDEQDYLIKQLRRARYFEVFHYDSQRGNWNCMMCKTSEE